MKRLFALTVFLFTLFLFPAVAGGNDDDKVTICHAAGQAGTTKYVTITISRSALKGHFDEKGTPLAGHEQDYFGACKTDASPTPTPKPSATAAPSATTAPTTAPTAPTVVPTARPTATAAPAAPAATTAPKATAKPVIKSLPSTSTN